MRRTRSRGLLVTALGAATISTLAACQWIAGLSQPEPPTEAGVDAPVGVGNAEACGELPGRPQAAPATSSDVAPFWMVIGRIVLDQNDLGDGGGPFCESFGFDLDSRHTCFTDEGASLENIHACPIDQPCGPSCENPSSTSTERSTCDLDKSGVDNSLAKLRSSLPALAVGRDSSEALDPNRGVARGEFALMIQVSGYSGLPDDPDVRVSLAVAAGLTSLVKEYAGGVPEGGIPEAGPRWDTEDASEPTSWTLSSDSVDAATGYSIPLFSGDGYVARGMLVANLGSAQFPFGATQVTLSTVRIAGRLDRLQNDLFELRYGRFGARMPVADVFRVISTIKNPGTGGKQLCPSTPAFKLVGPVVCRALDLNNPSAADDQCTSLSAGFTFHALPAIVARDSHKSLITTIGDPCPSEAIPTRCDDSGTAVSDTDADAADATDATSSSD